MTVRLLGLKDSEEMDRRANWPHVEWGHYRYLPNIPLTCSGGTTMGTYAQNLAKSGHSMRALDER